MRPTLEAGVARFRRRRRAGRWLESSGRHVQVAWFVAGAAALLTRVAAGWERTEAAGWLALGLVALGTAFLQVRKRVPSAATAAAWLDVQGGAQGWVVTARELGDSDWSAGVEVQLASALERLPALPWKRSLVPTLPAAAFAALAVWVPIPEREPGPPPIVSDRALEALAEELATLEQTLELPPEVRAEFHERLERLEASAADEPPASTFEAIDRLGERFQHQAELALEAALRAAQDLEQSAGDPRLDAAQAALQDALDAMEGAGLGKNLPESVRGELLPGTLTLPEAAELGSAELAKLSRELQSALGQKLGQLGAARLLDPSRLKELQRALDGSSGDGFADFDPTHTCDDECKQPGGT